MSKELSLALYLVGLNRLQIAKLGTFGKPYQLCHVACVFNIVLHAV
jgi:hypothetical protein